MIKRYTIAAIVCLFAFSTWGFAEEKTTPPSITGWPVTLEFYSTLQTYYKVQDNYRTPLDGNDRFIADANDNGGSDSAVDYESETTSGSKDRHGANNRADQNSRTIGDISLVGRSGKMETDGIEWYKMIGVLQFQIDANDPDHPDTTDGERKARVRHKDAWIRYSPILPLGIKVGTQTVAATATAHAIGHRYAGDQDDDFVYYTAATLLEVPGISVDLHISKDIELGVGSFEGMGDASEIASGGDTSQARNNVAWFKGNFGTVELTAAYQSVAVGDTTDDSNGVQDEYQHEYKHSILNTCAKFNLMDGDIQPYLAYQVLDGDKVKNPLVSGQINTAVSSFGEALEVQEDESRSMKGNFISVGIIAKVGPGKLAFDYTKSDVPAYGETDTVPALIELDYATQLNYEYQISEDASITAFYNHTAAKKDSKLRDDITHMENNLKLSSSRTLQKYKTLLETYRWTSTTSYGLSFKIKFGN